MKNSACKAELTCGGVAFDAASFVACASSGQLLEVKLFTCAGIRLNMPRTDGDTALIAAARHDQREVMRHLLSLPEIDINAKNQVGDTALMTATCGDHDEIVGYLLDHEGIKLNLKNEDGDTALIVAAREGHQKIVAKLLQHPDIDVDFRNKADESALLEAARREYQQIVKQFRDAGAVEPELEKVARWQLEKEGVYTETHFVRSTARGDIELTQKYLLAGMDVNAQDDRGETGLTAATRSGKPEMIKLLLGQPNVDVNLPNLEGSSNGCRILNCELAAIIHNSRCDTGISLNLVMRRKMRYKNDKIIRKCL